MKEQKNIDRLFQEKFKDFEVAPPEMAWNNIEARLIEKKKKRRVIPFWFKASGIAASLLLGFYLYTNFNTINITTNSENTTVEKNSNQEIDNNSINKTNDFLNKNENVVSSENENVISPNNSNNKVQIQSSDDLNKKQNQSIINSSKKLLSVSKNKINNKDNKANQKIYESNVIVYEKNKTQNETLNLFENKIDFEKINGVFEKNKNSAVIVDKSSINKTQDSSLIAKISEEVTALEQLLKENEVGKNVEEKEKESKWGVSTFAAPIYLSSTTNGSSINSGFTENEKTYISTLSYGLGVNYNISKKLSVRAGINSLLLEYNTNDVSYSSTLKKAPEDGSMLSRNSNGQNIVFVNRNSSKSLSSDVDNFIPENRGTVNQTTNYFEIPLELNYSLLDKKLGIDLIGGMSTLFLNNNSVSLLTDGMEMDIGEANNLNNVHFSTNIGIGLKYKILKSFEANFNPMFKYQLNTYTDNSGNFKPYFIGLYSGLSYKF